MRLIHRSLIVTAVRAFLIVEFFSALITERWSVAFIAVVTLVLTFVPEIVVRRLGVKLPLTFISAITLFVFATIFLGEVLDFYERYWWWDILLHGGSSVGFGLIGVVFALFLFEGDRYAAPPWALSLIAFSFAVTIGSLWEIFEFGMDQIFGTNMQKSGLVDTMGDMIVNTLGASVAAGSGFLFFLGRVKGGPGGVFAEFVRLNRRLFRRFR